MSRFKSGIGWRITIKFFKTKASGHFFKSLFMKVKICILFAAICSLMPLISLAAGGDQATAGEFRAQFFQLCDLAVAKIEDSDSKGPYFVDSYAVRALCVAYDMTGKKEYLNACRMWSERMVKCQESMSPAGAYYMHYNRKPGESSGDWYAADSSSIGMGVVATAARCEGAEKKRFLESAEKFADLVLKNYVRSSGGVSDGLWSKSNAEWWCSSGLFGSFSFVLYANTGNERYLRAGLHVTDWLNQLDLTKDQPFPLKQQGPAMIMYVLENYSSGWPYITKNHKRKNAALVKVSWCLDWIAKQEEKPIADSQWKPATGWGMKFGGLPFHQYMFSHYLGDEKLLNAGDQTLQQLAAIVFTGTPELTQLPIFMMMSYAERLDPGAIYHSGAK
jgi:hypothetical protein